jgi:hypothetical protein
LVAQRVSGRNPLKIPSKHSPAVVRGVAQSPRFHAAVESPLSQDFHFGLLAALTVHPRKWFAITLFAVVMRVCHPAAGGVL